MKDRSKITVLDPLVKEIKKGFDVIFVDCNDSFARFKPITRSGHVIYFLSSKTHLPEVPGSHHHSIVIQPKDATPFVVSYLVGKINWAEHPEAIFLSSSLVWQRGFTVWRMSVPMCSFAKSPDEFEEITDNRITNESMYEIPKIKAHSRSLGRDDESVVWSNFIGRERFTYVMSSNGDFLTVTDTEPHKYPIFEEGGLKYVTVDAIGKEYITRWNDLMKSKRLTYLLLSPRVKQDRKVEMAKLSTRVVEPKEILDLPYPYRGEAAELDPTEKDFEVLRLIMQVDAIGPKTMKAFSKLLTSSTIVGRRLIMPPHVRESLVDNYAEGLVRLMPKGSIYIFDYDPKEGFFQLSEEATVLGGYTYEEDEEGIIVKIHRKATKPDSPTPLAQQLRERVRLVNSLPFMPTNI